MLRLRHKQFALWFSFFLGLVALAIAPFLFSFNGDESTVTLLERPVTSAYRGVVPLNLSRKSFSKLKNYVQEAREKSAEVKSLQWDTLTDSMILNKIQTKQPEFTRCFENHLRSYPNSAGVLKIDLLITPQGQVTQTKLIEDPIGDEKLQSCALRVLGSLSFPRFQGHPILISVPLSFG